MAFGDLRTTFSTSSATIANPMTASGSQQVTAGDLIFVVFAEQTDLSASGCSDNLTGAGGNYIAVSAGVDAGTITERCFYKIVPPAQDGQTLTSVSVACTAGGGQDVAMIAAIFEGPFSAIDKNIAPVSDIVAAFTCAASGALTQYGELVIGYASMIAAVTNWTCALPWTLAANVGTGNASCAIAYQRILNSVATVSPAFNAGTAPTADQLGTVTFRKASVRGDLIRAGTLTGTSILASNDIACAVTVAVGDLIVCVMSEQTTKSATGAGDNLHGAGTYTALTGADGGAATGRAFYKYVTTAGALTTVSIAAAATGDNFACAAVVFKGPFASSPLDANPADGTGDLSSPFTCPTTSTLAQKNELVLVYSANDANNVLAATAPNLLAVQAGTTSVHVAIGYQNVNSTGALTPEFTGTNPTSHVLGTMSFKYLTQGLTPAYDTGDTDVFYVPKTTQYLQPSFYTDTDTFYVPRRLGGPENFGDVLGCFSVTQASVTNPTVVNCDNTPVQAGDLVFIVWGVGGVEALGTITDGLGTVYTEGNTGDDTSLDMVCAYGIVAKAGLLNDISMAATVAASKICVSVCIYRGPFSGRASTNLWTHPDVDHSSPYGSGNVTRFDQYQSLAISYGASIPYITNWAVTAPLVVTYKAGNADVNISCVTAHAVTGNSLAAVSPSSFTGSAITNGLFGTMCFRKKLNFGEVRGTYTGFTSSVDNATTIANEESVYGVRIDVGDLIVAVMAEQTALTFSDFSTTGLANVFTGQNAGTLSGVVSGRMLYGVVTVAGTPQTCLFIGTLSNDDASCCAVVIRGPFAALDANPANVSDITSPFACPVSGTLAQKDEVVIGWGTAGGGGAWTAATAPSIFAVSNTTLSAARSYISVRSVNDTASVTPEFTTGGAAPTNAVLGTASFKHDRQLLSPTTSFTDTDIFYVPSMVPKQFLTHAARYDDGDAFYAPTAAIVPSYAVVSWVDLLVTPSTLQILAPTARYTDPDTFYVPAISRNIFIGFYTDNDVFYEPTVALVGGAAQPLTVTTRYDDNEAFYVPTVHATRTLTVTALYTDTDTFYAPTVHATRVLVPSFYSDTDVFYVPTAYAIRTLVPSLYTDTDIFFAPNLGRIIHSSFYSELATQPVTFLLHGDGIDGSTTIIDEAGHVVTIHGDVQIDTAQSVFGGGSIYFDGVGDYLSLDGSVDFAFGTGDYTIDFWIRVPSGLIADQYYSMFQNFYPYGYMPVVAIDSDSYFVYFDDTIYPFDPSPTLLCNVWYHFAHTRANGTVRNFINGVQYGSSYESAVDLGVEAGQPYIGLFHDDDYDPDYYEYFKGWIDEFRIIKGYAAWTSNFTPPTASYSASGDPIETFYPPKLSFVIHPSFYTDTDVFYAPTIATTAVAQNLAPSFYTDTDVFYVPTVHATRTLVPSLYTDTDVFYAPTAHATRTLVPSFYTDTDVFYAPIVHATHVLVPSFFIDTDVFYTSTVHTTRTLVPSLFTDTDVFYAPTVVRGAHNLAPNFYTDNDIFYAPTVTRGTVNLAPNLYTDTDVFYAPTVHATRSLAPNLFTDTDVFYAPTVHATRNLAPNLYTDTDVFYAPTAHATRTLVPAFYTDVDVFYSPTVHAARMLVPSFYTDTDVFYAPTVHATRNLAPNLYTDTDVFYAPTVHAARILAPNLYTDNDIFYTPTVHATHALLPGFYTDVDAFYAPTLASTRALFPSFYTDIDVFYAPTAHATKNLAPNLYTDVDVFYAPSITTGVVNIAPSFFTDTDIFFTTTVASGGSLFFDRYDDTDIFYAPTITTGTVNIAPSFYIDPDVFYAPSSGRVLYPSLFTDVDIFYAPSFSRSLAVGFYAETDVFYAPKISFVIHPSLFTDNDIFYTPTVNRGAVNLQPTRYEDTDIFYAPTVAAGEALFANLYTDTDIFYAPTVSTTAAALFPSFFTDTDVFYAPKLSFVVHPQLYTDNDIFYTPTITTGATNLAPSLYTDNDIFYAPAVSSGAFLLVPSFYTDTDVFFAPTVSFVIYPSFYTDVDIFYTPTVTSGAANIAPSFYLDTDTFFGPSIHATYNLAPNRYDDIDIFYPPTAAPGVANVAPNLYLDPDIFFTPQLTGGEGSSLVCAHVVIEPLFAGNVSLKPIVSGDPSAYTALDGDPTLGAVISAVPSVYPALDATPKTESVLNAAIDVMECD